LKEDGTWSTEKQIISLDREACVRDLKKKLSVLTSLDPQDIVLEFFLSLSLFFNLILILISS
jgi:hypothetical protein